MPGDTAALARMRQKLQTLSKEGIERVSKTLSLEAVAQSQACFRESRDPYGQPWAPLKHRDGKPLLDTGRLRASIAVQSSSPLSFRIGTNVQYGAYHQGGVDAKFTRAPSSRFMPINKRGRFTSKGKAGAAKGKSVAVRRLDFKGGETHLVIPQRAYLPIAGRGLGPIWTPAFKRVGLSAIAKIVKGG
jgi:phage gpG-like protein